MNKSFQAWLSRFRVSNVRFEYIVVEAQTLLKGAFFFKKRGGVVVLGISADFRSNLDFGSGILNVSVSFGYHSDCVVTFKGGSIVEATS